MGTVRKASRYGMSRRMAHFGMMSRIDPDIVQVVKLQGRPIEKDESLIDATKECRHQDRPIMEHIVSGVRDRELLAPYIEKPDHTVLDVMGITPKRRDGLDLWRRHMLPQWETVSSKLQNMDYAREVVCSLTGEQTVDWQSEVMQRIKITRTATGLLRAMGIEAAARALRVDSIGTFRTQTEDEVGRLQAEFDSALQYFDIPEGLPIGLQCRFEKEILDHASTRVTADTICGNMADDDLWED